MELLVRRAVAADADRLGQVHVATWREAYAHIISAEALARLSEEQRADRWRTIIAEPGNGEQYLAELDGVIVGFSGAGPGRDDAPPREYELYSLYVLAEYHGTSAGQTLLDAAIGDRPSFLWVAEKNPRAQAFYRRNGFSPDGVRQVTPCAGGQMPELRMLR